MKVTDKTDKPSKDAGHLISEAFELMVDASSSTETKERIVRPMHQTGDYGNVVQDVMKIRVTRQRHIGEQARTDFDTEASPIDSSKSISPEQSFWFKLAGSDMSVSE